MGEQACRWSGNDFSRDGRWSCVDEAMAEVVSLDLDGMETVDLAELELMELAAASNEVRDPNLDKYYLAETYVPDKIVTNRPILEEE